MLKILGIAMAIEYGLQLVTFVADTSVSHQVLHTTVLPDFPFFKGSHLQFENFCIFCLLIQLSQHFPILIQFTRIRKFNVFIAVSS